MTLTKKQIITVIMLLALVFSLPVAIYLTRKMQDVRPRALQGKANFLLSTDSINSTVGKNIDVLVTLQTTDPKLKVSGVDFVLLYDKNRLDVGNIVPNVTAVDPKAPFTDSLIVTSGGSFDENFNFLRVSQIARRPTDQLPTGTFQLAKITFRGRSQGQASIKFPDDDKYLEVVGTGTAGVNPTPTGIYIDDPAGRVSLTPENPLFKVGENLTMDLKLDWNSMLTVLTKLDYFKVEIAFPKEFIKMPANAYIDTSMSGLKKIFRVDGPTAANESGKIVIELGADVPGGGPLLKSNMTIAKITFSGFAIPTMTQKFVINSIEAVSDRSQVIVLSTRENPIGVITSSR